MATAMLNALTVVNRGESAPGFTTLEFTTGTYDAQFATKLYVAYSCTSNPSPDELIITEIRIVTEKETTPEGFQGVYLTPSANPVV
eukprot:m.59703 g.59703  ORF g.59703 m.59703 type:complete len:86 (+) comp13604_c0_seq3:73-330(+)